VAAVALPSYRRFLWFKKNAVETVASQHVRIGNFKECVGHLVGADGSPIPQVWGRFNHIHAIGFSPQSYTGLPGVQSQIQREGQPGPEFVGPDVNDASGNTKLTIEI
jgi:hypothetical protein